MKAYPIIFSGPMVKEILAGRKTQTRRIIGDWSDLAEPTETRFAELQRQHGRYPFDMLDGDGQRYHGTGGGRLMQIALPCPYGQVGDQLWVRETIRGHYLSDGRWCASYAADGSGVDLTCFHPAMGHKQLYCFSRSRTVQPAIHMPRWASRLTLRITDVRVECLQDISEKDILAEGCSVDNVATPCGHSWSGMPTLHHVWQVAWNKINAKRATWEDNPWVWVLEFARVEQ